MGETSRRKVLGVAVAGAVGTAGAVALGGGAAQAVTSRERLVAYVGDPASGELVLMSGDREIAVHDVDLVARLVRAAGGN